EAGLYIVRVDMFHWGGRSWEREATQALQFSLLPSPDAPEQVFDVYMLACAAAPALSGDLAELRTQFDSAAGSIATQSQAALRLHWITRLGYGRDPCYAPFVNMTAPADQSTPQAYWLPGQLGGGSEGSFLYRADAIDSLCLTETGLATGRTQQGALPVTVADQNNHCMRTPAARALFDQRVAAGVEREDEPPLQLLLDDLASRPERYRNAVFVNLHGPGLPMPPLRNFADAARDPEHQPGVRVVTHPARLQTPRDPNGDGNHADTQPLELRVYAWRTQGSGDVLTDPVLVQIFGPDLTSAINAAASPSLQICRLQGAIDTKIGKANGSGRAYIGFDETGGTAPVAGEDTYSMHYEAGFVGGPGSYTWLKLYNTPLTAPVVGTRGLPASSRLYGLEYCPAPPTGTFAHDLAHDNTAAEMRNTARWRIRIPSTVFTSVRLPNSDQVVRVVTRIGASTATGIRWPAPVEPLNVSETFAWWSRSTNAVPVTERCQFLGDPRLCPY